MQLSQKAIDEFKIAWKESFGEDISDERARMEAIPLMRINKFQSSVLGAKIRQEPQEIEVDIRNYAKYILKEGEIREKRDLLGNVKSRLIYMSKKVTI